MSTSHAFPLAPLHRTAWLVLIAIPVAVVVAAVLFPETRQQLPAPGWLLAPFFVALLVVPLALALNRRRITLEGRTLVVAATFYTRKVDVDALDLGYARIVDLAEHTEFAPRLKLNGYNLPYFRAGHFLLGNRSRAFCLLTARDRVLVLPQRDGKTLLLSPERPRDLLERLRELATPPPRR